jgi:hypothetical protein
MGLFVCTDRGRRDGPCLNHADDSVAIQRVALGQFLDELDFDETEARHHGQRLGNILDFWREDMLDLLFHEPAIKFEILDDALCIGFADGFWLAHVVGPISHTAQRSMMNTAADISVSMVYFSP